jgi:hypothetical protein
LRTRVSSEKVLAEAVQPSLPAAATCNASQSELMPITARDPKSIYANTTQELPTKFNRSALPVSVLELCAEDNCGRPSPVNLDNLDGSWSDPPCDSDESACHLCGPYK